MRRARGEGTIFYDETNARWVGRIDLGRDPATGRRQRRSVTGSTKKETAARLRSVRDEVLVGMDTVSNPTVDELLDRWLDRTAPRRSETTNTMYRHLADRHVAVIGGIRVDRLTVRDVEDWLDARSHLARSTLKKLRSLLGQVLDYGIRLQIVSMNVARMAELPPDATVSRQPRSLNRDEAARLLAAAEGHRLAAWFSVMLGTGARPGEVAALRWDDVDLDAGTLRFVATKTGGQVRTLRVAASVVDALRQHRKRQDEEQLLMGARWPDEHHDLVFQSEAGTPVDAANARRLVRSIAVAAGIGHLTPYELRHSHASLLSDAGTHAEALSDRMGHRDSRTTLAYYRHQVSPVIEAGAEIDLALGGETQTGS